MSWLTLLLVVFLSACAPDFTEQWEVNEPRLTGARVEVEGDPSRPRPRLDERFSLRMNISLPSGNWPTPLAERYSFDVSLCLGFLSSTGLLVCLGEQQLATTVTPINDNEVLISGLGFDLSGLGFTPEQITQATDLADLSEIDRLALFGVFCVDGAPERVAGTVAGKDPTGTLYRCNPRSGATFTDPTTFALSVYFDRGLATDANRNPSFACDPTAPDSACNAGTKVDDEPVVPGSFVIAKPKPKGGTGPREVIAWPARDPATLPWENCSADPSLIQIRAKSGEHTLRARFDASDREQYAYTLPVNGVPETRTGREALVLTHQVTQQAGDLSRFESKLAADDPDSEAEISFRWTPPKKGADLETIPDTGRLVRFYFTLRDERGGVDFTTRELCLLPALRGG